MTDAESLRHVKSMLEQLANGIDPVSGQPAKEDDCINQVQVVRCLFQAAGVLGRVIGDCEAGERQQETKPSGTYPWLVHRRIPVSDTPVTVSEITGRINELTEGEEGRKIKAADITSFLMERGFLEVVQEGEGSCAKRPTEKGRELGISVQERTGRIGPYRVTVYDADAQRYIMDGIDALLLTGQTGPGPKKAYAFLQGEKWTEGQDEALREMARRQVPVSVMASVLKRTERGIRARLVRLEIVERRSDAK